MNQRMGFMEVVQKKTATEWGDMVEYVVVNRQNTCKLRKLLHQLDKTCTANAHNIDKWRNAWQVAKITTHGCFMKALKSDGHTKTHLLPDLFNLNII